MEEIKEASGQPAEAPEVSEQEQVGQEPAVRQVSYDSHRKLLAEKKKLAERLGEIESKFNSLNEEKLTAEGKKDELIDTYKKQLAEMGSKLEAQNQKMAYDSVSRQFARKAESLGCVDADRLFKLAELSDVDIDENYKVDDEDLTRKMDQLKKEMPYFFSKPAPRVEDGVPAKPEKPGLDLGKMSGEQRIKHLSLEIAKKLGE